jgi:hypothetical protein
MTKIGRYYQKIGISIGSTEGGNFAHLWIKAIPDLAMNVLARFTTLCTLMLCK